MNISALVRTTSIPILSIFAAAGVLAMDTNEWTKPADGKWEEPFWSLNELPDRSQSILIDSAAPTTLTIDSATAQAHPASLMVSQLVLTGKTTLVIDRLPAATSVRIVGVDSGDDLSLQSDSTLINIQSDLVVGNSESGTLNLRGGRVFQGGGSIRAGNTFIPLAGEYHLTNGVFASGRFTLGVGAMIRASFFNQYGGTAEIGSFTLDGQEYSLSGGDLIVRTNTSVLGTGFVQSGGTHRVPSLSLFPSYNGGGPGSYSLAGGTLSVSNLGIGAFVSGSTFAQSGGILEITDTLTLTGSSRYHPPVQIPAVYALTSGTMRADIVELNSRFGQAQFTQVGGIVSIARVLRLNVPDANTRSHLNLDGGMLRVATMSADGAGADIRQTHGELIVTNGFSFGGFIPPPYWASGDRRVPRYDFLGGTLQAAGIEIAGEMSIGSSIAPNRIANRGVFTLAGTLTAGDSREDELGSLLLATNSLIDLGPGHAQLAFANSAAVAWNSASILIVTNWVGLLNGGGDDRISFGATASGLTTQQLGRIRFVNPAGLTPGEYPAAILESGEIVPHKLPSIDVSSTGTKLTLRWAESVRLQTSTNVTGPYLEIPAAASPYEIDVTQSHQRYYRLQ